MEKCAAKVFHNPKHVALVFPMSASVHLGIPKHYNEWKRWLLLLLYRQCMDGWINWEEEGAIEKGEERRMDVKKISVIDNLVAKMACYFASLWFNKEQ